MIIDGQMDSLPAYAPVPLSPVAVDTVPHGSDLGRLLGVDGDKFAW
jgi:hypothetical protein